MKFLSVSASSCSSAISSDRLHRDARETQAFGTRRPIIPTRTSPPPPWAIEANAPLRSWGFCSKGQAGSLGKNCRNIHALLFASILPSLARAKASKSESTLALQPDWAESTRALQVSCTMRYNKIRCTDSLLMKQCTCSPALTRSACQLVLQADI